MRTQKKGGITYGNINFREVFSLLYGYQFVLISFAPFGIYSSCLIIKVESRLVLFCRV